MNKYLWTKNKKTGEWTYKNNILYLDTNKNIYLIDNSKTKHFISNNYKQFRDLLELEPIDILLFGGGEDVIYK